tara:strand:- start:266 stop:454 length:189 start_codon:yes stop_codon:yes gene_type:complete
MSEQLMGNPLYEPSKVLKSELDREKRKWESRYKNQDKRIKALEQSNGKLKDEVRNLKKQLGD